VSYALARHFDAPCRARDTIRIVVRSQISFGRWAGLALFISPSGSLGEPAINDRKLRREFLRKKWLPTVQPCCI
jgi:hypothetical protein